MRRQDTPFVLLSGTKPGGSGQSNQGILEEEEEEDKEEEESQPKAGKIINYNYFFSSSIVFSSDKRPVGFPYTRNDGK